METRAGSGTPRPELWYSSIINALVRAAYHLSLRKARETTREFEWHEFEEVLDCVARTSPDDALDDARRLGAALWSRLVGGDLAAAPWDVRAPGSAA